MTSGGSLVTMINAAMQGVGILLGIPEPIYRPSFPALFSRNKLPSRI
jgi:hypothetical protein